MAFNVQFGTVGKSYNSTLTGYHPVVLACELKEECSALTPSLFVSIDENSLFGSGTLNHCYIAEFDRYYFVDNWTYERGMWRADCSVDVMASFRYQIENSNQYVLRCSQAFDGSIYDTLYPVKNVIHETNIGIYNPYTIGYYIVGIISDQGGIGSVNYYVMNAAGYNAFCGVLFGGNYIDMTDILQDMSIETWKSLYNPFQYIVSCMYFPVPVPFNGGSEYIHVGYWDLQLWGNTLSLTQDIFSSSVSLASPIHPNAGRGDFVYCSPYTELELTWLPFCGSLSLPPDVFYSRGIIDIDMVVDFITGSGTLYIGGNGDPVAVLSGQVGVPIQISQMHTDYLNMATTAISSVADSVSAGMKGDIAGAISNAATGIDSSIRSAVPKLQTTGANGSFSNVNSWPTLTIRFRELVDEDNAHLGRPLCQTVNIGSLGAGYIKCEGAKVSTPGTFEENNKVIQIMNEGFYYE